MTFDPHPKRKIKDEASAARVVTQQVPRLRCVCKCVSVCVCCMSSLLINNISWNTSAVFLRIR